MWPDRRLLELFGIEHPILQAPMAGASGPDLAIAVARGGGLGALPCAMLSPDEVRAAVTAFRDACDNPLNLNFFCHEPPRADTARDAAWRQQLAPYYSELGLAIDQIPGGATRQPFDESLCDVVEETRPEVVSFHFGLPDPRLLERVKASGAKVIASATTVAEARWLSEHGCDAIIAQGYEAGGHRGMFLGTTIDAQPGTLALVPQVVDAVSVPVIAAGGIGDSRGIVAALALGAAGVQLGTAYLHCPEAIISPLHRAALARAREEDTRVTNLFTGRPARGIVNRFIAEAGPTHEAAPAFPLAAAAVAPLRAAAEARGRGRLLRRSGPVRQHPWGTNAPPPH